MAWPVADSETETPVMCCVLAAMTGAVWEMVEVNIQGVSVGSLEVSSRAPVEVCESSSSGRGTNASPVSLSRYNLTN